MSLTPEAAQVSGLSYVMDAYREEAEKIINAQPVSHKFLLLGRLPNFHCSGGIRFAETVLV